MKFTGPTTVFTQNKDVKKMEILLNPYQDRRASALKLLWEIIKGLIQALGK